MITITKWAAITILSLAVATSALFVFGAMSCSAPHPSATAPDSMVRTLHTPIGQFDIPVGGSVIFEYEDSAPKQINNVASGEADAGEAHGDDVKLEGVAAMFDLNAMTAGPGKTKASAETKAKFTFLILLGALLIVGGIVVWIWLKQATLGLALVAAGGVIITLGIVAATAPWVFIVVLAVLACVVGFLLYKSWKAKQATTGLTAAASGIDAIKTIGPADLAIQIDAADYPKAQAIIDATYNVIKSRLAQASEKLGGVLAKFSGK